MVGVYLQEKDTRLQDFEPKIGVGICPRVGLYPELYGTVHALDPFHKTSSTNTRRSARFFIDSKLCGDNRRGFLPPSICLSL